jgi:hypothetical protein
MVPPTLRVVAGELTDTDWMGDPLLHNGKGPVHGFSLLPQPARPRHTKKKKGFVTRRKGLNDPSLPMRHIIVEKILHSNQAPGNTHLFRKLLDFPIFFE